MKTILDFFGDAHKPVALATVNEGKPAVRFLSFKMFENGKLYFLTSKKKSIYKELEANNNLEICSMPNENLQWARVRCQVKFVRDVELNKKAFEILDLLEKVYQQPENPDLVLLEIVNPEGMMFGMSGETKEIQLI